MKIKLFTQTQKKHSSRRVGGKSYLIFIVGERLQVLHEFSRAARKLARAPQLLKIIFLVFEKKTNSSDLS